MRVASHDLGAVVRREEVCRDGAVAVADLDDGLRLSAAAGPLHDDDAMLLLRYHGHGEGKSVPIT